MDRRKERRIGDDELDLVNGGVIIGTANNGEIPLVQLNEADDADDGDILNKLAEAAAKNSTRGNFVPLIKKKKNTKRKVQRSKFI
ncbi:MAG: hypothetical protein IJI92_02705 [Erysipelotrichaceae bacterium]|nr:hypothetical protein [Erysipelotrichaceae bacterium]